MKPDIRLTVRRAALREKIENPSQLASEADISRSMATAAWNDEWKDGDRLPDLRTLLKIATAIGCDIGDLVRFVGTRRPKSRNGNGAS
jgi:transcriptional regulator with XRE-family HTH domain